MLTLLRAPNERVITSRCELATARSCIALLIERFRDLGVVYLPSITPEGLLGPFRRGGCDVRRYRLRANLEPDYDHLESLMKGDEKIGALDPLVVVVHYCGYPMPTERACELAREYGGILLEDCAQALVGPAALASDADVVLYSLNKFLPHFGAGLMFSRNRRIDISCEPKHEIVPEAVDAYLDHLDANHRLSRSRGMAAACALLDSEHAYDRYYALIELSYEPRKPPQYGDAARLRGDYALLAGHRHAASATWAHDHLRARLTGAPVFALPILCGGRRQQLEEALWAEGFMPSRFADRWSVAEGREHVDEHADARAFMLDHLLLPIHEGVSEGQMRDMSAIAARVIG